jgi:hypothetical protein
VVGYGALRRHKLASASTARIKKDIVIEAILHTFTFESANHVALEAVRARVSNDYPLPYRRVTTELNRWERDSGVYYMLIGRTPGITWLCVMLIAERARRGSENPKKRF